MLLSVGGINDRKVPAKLQRELVDDQKIFTVKRKLTAGRVRRYTPDVTVANAVFGWSARCPWPVIRIIIDYRRVAPYGIDY